MEKSLKLTAELVPSTCWYVNVRSNVPVKIWDIIRKKCYSLANYKCEICGDTGKNQGVRHDVECHEIWEYDDKKHTQTLKGLISLCPQCHQVKHSGLAGIKGKTHEVIKQLIKVNEMTNSEASEYLTKCFEIYHERSEYQWTLDISLIEEYIKY